MHLYGDARNTDFASVDEGERLEKFDSSKNPARDNGATRVATRYGRRNNSQNSLLTLARTVFLP